MGYYRETLGCAVVLLQVFETLSQWEKSLTSNSLGKHFLTHQGFSNGKPCVTKS